MYRLTGAGFQLCRRGSAAGRTQRIRRSRFHVTRRETIRRLAIESRPYLSRLVVAMLLSLIAGWLTLVPPFAFRIIINDVLAPPRGHTPDLRAFYLALLGTFAALLLANLATYGQTYTLTWTGQRIIRTLRQRLFERVLDLPLSEFDKWRPGELISRFNSDMQMMGDAVGTSLPQLVVALITFVSSLGFMIYLDWLLTLTLIIIAPLISFSVSRFQRLISSSMQTSQQRVADLSVHLTEVLNGERIVKAFGREQYEADRFAHRNDDYFGSFMKLAQFVQTQPLVVSTIMTGGVVIIMWLSVREVLVGRLDVGRVFQFWLLLVNLVNPMNRVAAFFGDLSKAIVSTGRVYEVLDLPAEERDRENAVPMPPIQGRIVFDDVSFWYKSDEPSALSHVDATIEEGEIVALVGPSGAGKTTIVNLVPRFYEPQEGRVLVDGIDLARVRLASLRSQIAIVPQDVQLFRASIAENIRYSRLDATMDEVRAAAIEANADEFVRHLPEGYATEVGERGVRLSGGERQRIAIARAILRDPRILILDEATSALDSHSEALIEEALDRLLPGRTTLIIAHRLSTIRRAHRILYIEAGRLLEIGTHDELLARNGRYARLHAAQFETAPGGVPQPAGLKKRSPATDTPLDG
jgi:subfamily B ATP-binding cassette protein MsbA